jgi:translocation and assembly module TamB
MNRIFALVVCLILPFSAVAQNSDEDVGYLAGLLQDALSGAGRDVRIRGFKGALSSQASIEVISISDDQGEWFRAESIVLDWTRSALLRGIVDVNAFTADRIVISRAPDAGPDVPSAEAAPFQIPDLPVSISINEIDAKSIVLGAPLLGEEAEFTVTGAASLDGGAADILFNLDRVDGQGARIRLDASYAPSTRLLAIDLAAEEDARGLVGRLLNIPGQPALALTVQGEGSIEEFKSVIALTTDGQPRISGTVDILSPEADASWDVRVDIQGDPTPVMPETMHDFFGNDISLQARAIRDAEGRIELPDFALSAKTLSLAGSAAIGANGWPEAMDVRGRLVNPDGGPVVFPFGAGDTQVSQVTFDAALNGDLTFDAQLDDFRNPMATLETLTLTGRGNVDPQSFATDGRFDLALTWLADTLALTDPALAAAIGTRLSGAAQVDYQSGQPIGITGIEASGADYGLTGDATFDTAQTIPLALDLRVVAQDIARFSGLAGRDLAGRAEATIVGDIGPVSGMFDLVIDATTLDIQVAQDVADRILAGVGSARIDVRRDETGTTIRTARVVTPGATIDAAGRITSDTTDVTFGGSLRNLDHLYPGEAEGSAELRGSVSLSSVRLTELNLNAELSNGSGPVRLPFAGGLSLDTATVEAVATGGPTGTWTTQVQTRDLRSSVLSASALELSGAGALSQTDSGALASIGGDITAAGAGVRMADARLAQALGSAPSVVATFDWTQDSERLELGRFALDTGSIDATGSAVLTDILSSVKAQFSTSVVADSLAPLSGLAGQSLQGRANIDVTGSYAVAGAFDVTASGQGSGLGIGNPVVNRLLAGVTEFDLSANGQNAVVDRIALRVSNPEITANVNGALDDLTIDARLRDVGLVAPDFQGPLSVAGTVRQQGSDYAVDVALDGPGGTTLDVAGRVGTGSNADLSINGVAPLGLANAFIEPRRLNGQAQLNLALRGALALTSLSGTITPVEAELSAPTLGIVLKPITGQIAVNGGAADINLTAEGNNGGSVAVNGRFGLTSLDANLTATLRRFGVRDPALYDTSVDGTVNLSGPIGRALLISGDLRLNKTEIQVPSSGAFVLGDIPNIEHLGATRPVMRTLERAKLTNTAETTTRSGPSTTRLDLTLSAPNQVFVRGRGLDAELGGSLRLTGPTSDIIPQGGFELVRGRLDILNQRFVLDEGRIQMSGSFVPVLRFVASTAANGIVVQIILDGPASSPDISFTSTPELPEDEVLAQLLFGRSLSNMSALQALELANAVATLAGGGSGGLLTNLRDSFGLDDLDVSQNDDGSTAVRAGKYISENIYTDVVVDSGGKTEINLNLDVTSDITARGSVDNTGNSSLGVFFERDY